MFRSFLPLRGLHAFLLMLLTFALPFAAQAAVFTGGSCDVFPGPDPRCNSSWQNPYNWEGEQVPTGEATIPAGRVVDLTESVTIGTLNIAGDGNTLIRASNTQDLTVTGTCNWSVGGMQGVRNLVVFQK